MKFIDEATARGSTAAQKPNSFSLLCPEEKKGRDHRKEKHQPVTKGGRIWTKEGDRFISQIPSFSGGEKQAPPPKYPGKEGKEFYIAPEIPSFETLHGFDSINFTRWSPLSMGPKKPASSKKSTLILKTNFSNYLSHGVYLIYAELPDAMLIAIFPPLNFPVIMQADVPPIMPYHSNKISKLFSPMDNNYDDLSKNEKENCC